MSNRPACKVKVTFYVHTDSSTSLLDQSIRRFVREELEGFGIGAEYTPVPTLEDLGRLLEKAEASDYKQMETSQLVKALEEMLGVMNAREDLRRVVAICKVLATRPIPRR